MSAASQPSLASQVFFVRGPQDPPEAPRPAMASSPTFIARSLAGALQLQEQLIAEGRQIRRAMRAETKLEAQPSLAIPTMTRFPWVVLPLLLGLILGYSAGLVVSQHVRPWLVLGWTAPAAPGPSGGAGPLATFAAPVTLAALPVVDAASPVLRVAHPAGRAPHARQPSSSGRYGF
jgi:hypothetical protein